MSETRTVTNLIIGAGLSGLSFANFSQNPSWAKSLCAQSPKATTAPAAATASSTQSTPVSSDSLQPISSPSASTHPAPDYLILEKDSSVGGYCRTIANPNYVWDYAGHFYHFKTDQFRRFFESLVDPAEIIRQVKNTKIYYHGRLIDYPFQTNIHQLPKAEFIDCLYDLFTKDETAPYHNYLEMLHTKFGAAITQKFLQPYNEKLYATDLTNLDKDAMGRFFPYADKDAIIRNMKEHAAASYNDTFLYLKRGTGFFIDRLAEQLDSARIQLNTSVLAIDLAKHQVTTSDHTTIHYQNLINTMPLNQFLALSSDPAHHTLAQSLSYNKVLVLNLGFDRPSPNFHDEHWLYFPDKNLNFYRVGFYNHILGEPKLSLYVEIGFDKTAKIDPAKELTAALAGLKQVGIIDDSVKLVDQNILIMDPAYVHISTTEDKKVQQTLAELEQQQIYNLGRYGRWTYNSMEDCMVLADTLAQKLTAAAHA